MQPKAFPSLAFESQSEQRNRVGSRPWFGGYHGEKLPGQKRWERD